MVLLSYYLWPYADCTLWTRSYSTLQSDYRWCYCPTTSGPTLTVPYGRTPTLPYSLTTGGVTVLLPLALRWLYPTDTLLLYPTVWLQVVLLSYYLWPYADCTLRTRSYSTLQSDYRWCYCPTTSGPTLTVPYGRAPTLPYSLTTGGVTVLLPLGPTLTVPYGRAPTLPYSLTTGGVTVLLPLALCWLYPTDALLLYPTVWLQVVLLSYYLWPYADCTLRTRSYSTLQSDYRWR